MSALAWRVINPISQVVGAQLIRTSGKDFRPSEWLSSYERTTKRGEFSGSSDRQVSIVGKHVSQILRLTFSQFLDTDTAKFLDLLNNEILLIALDNQGCASLAAACESKLAQGIL
jgi:hypothetical protein